MNKLEDIEKKEKELQAFTNKFIKEFLVLANEGKKNDDFYHFHFTLAENIANADIPMYEDQSSILMGMASFDDTIAKAMFNNRIQGFIKIIEDAVADESEQDDYYVNNIKTKDYLKDDFKLVFGKGGGVGNFKSVPCKTKAQTIKFDVSNSKSGFEGRVVMFKEMKKHFSDENTFIEKMSVKKIVFYVGNTEIMTINYKYNFETKKFYEEGSFTHYKHISDINSFYQTISAR